MLPLALLAGSISAAESQPKRKSAEAVTAPAKPALVKFNNGPKSTGAIGLTFDDGPHPKLTPRLMEILKKENVQATFFMLGEQVEKFPEIAKAVADGGFEIGNHTYDHKDLTKMSADEIRKEIERTQALIENATGKKPRLFRPPYGSVNARVAQIANELGLDIVLWSIDPRDWEAGKSQERILSKIMAEAAPGAIVCIHDIHQRTVDSVPAVIAALKEKGLGFASAGDLIDAEKADRERRKNDPRADVGGSEGGGASPVAAPKAIPLNKTRSK